MRFEANVSILFKEHPFVERFAAAKDAGFSAVEFWWPSGGNLKEIEEAIERSGLEVALLNFDAGDMAAGDRGLAGDPERYKEFLENVPVALEFAQRVGCRRLNALLGHELPGRREEQLKLAAQNVRYAADEARKRGLEVAVEAVNTFENGAFLLHTTAQGMKFVRRVGRENVGFQYDVYHMQRMEGNLIANLRANIAGISHVQIADSPDRHEPGTGEINFARVLAELEAAGYKGYVGLEYNPAGGDTLASLDWIPGASRSGDADLNSLGL